MVKTRENRECLASGKIVYLTEQDAMRSMVKMSKRFNVYFSHYSCRHCNHWHLTRVKGVKVRR